MDTTDTSIPRDQLKTPADLPPFQQLPGESPRAYNAFTAFFQLGHHRSLQAVADNCSISIDTIKKWSSRFDWKDRIQSFNAEMLEKEAAIQFALQQEEAAQWSARMAGVREQQWIAAQQLLAVAQCWLENFGDEQLERVTLSQVTRALVVASKLGRMALGGFGQIEPTRPRNQTRSTPSNRLHAPMKHLPQLECATRDSKPAMEEPSAPAAPVANDRKILVSVPESAEKCRLESNSENQMTNQISPSTFDCASTVSTGQPSNSVPCPSCQSRGLRRTQKIISSPIKCRKVPFETSSAQPAFNPPSEAHLPGTIGNSQFTVNSQGRSTRCARRRRETAQSLFPRNRCRKVRKSAVWCASVRLNAVSRFHPPWQPELPVNSRPSYFVSYDASLLDCANLQLE